MEVRLEHVFEGVFGFVDHRGQGLQAHGAAVTREGAEDLAIDLFESLVSERPRDEKTLILISINAEAPPEEEE